MAVRWGAVFALCTACRLGFDPRSAAPDTPAPDDAPAPPIAPTFVQHHADAGDAVDTLTTTFDGPVTAGDLLVVTVDFDPANNPQLSALTDSLGDTYEVLAPTGGPGTKDTQYIAYAVAVASGACTITSKLQIDSSSFFELRAHEYANVDAALPLDTFAGGTGDGSGTEAASTPDIATGEPNELVFGLIVDGLVTTGEGFTTRGTDFADITEDLVAVTPGTYRATASTTGPWAASVAAFRGAKP